MIIPTSLLLFGNSALCIFQMHSAPKSLRQVIAQGLGQYIL